MVWMALMSEQVEKQYKDENVLFTLFVFIENKNHGDQPSSRGR